MNDKIVLKSNNPEVVSKVQAFAQSIGVAFENQAEASNVIQLPSPAQKNSDSMASSVTQSMPEVEKNAILKAIENSKGNLTQAAKKLDIGRATLYRKMQQYNIEKNAFKKSA